MSRPSNHRGNVDPTGHGADRKKMNEEQEMAANRAKADQNDDEATKKPVAPPFKIDSNIKLITRSKN